MKRFVLVIFCVLALPVLASHIVGGEFEIIYIQPVKPGDSEYAYKINLILYFDLNNGNPDARDPEVVARIFRKRDNAVMRDVSLAMITETSVKYTQPECSVGGVKTSKIIYSDTVHLSPSKYSDPGGYYIVWERCCRNYNTNKLLNIVSVDPGQNNSNPDAAGQTFYLEFPPVRKNGQPFINSSPTLFPPLSDYACINKPYYTDFAGTDVDDDSLVYTLVTPFNTHSSVALPPGGPGPAPFPEVKWKFPYGLNNIIGGNPDLKISRDGLLTVTPGNIIGLFVFAVKCEEFRNGEKIGEVRRDFQMYVLDCPDAAPPQITSRKLGETQFTSQQRTLNFDSSVPDELRCVEVKVFDPDAFKSGGEKVKIRAIPIGFKGDVRSLISDSSATLNASDSSVIFKVCFGHCPFVDGPFQIGIIAADDACSLPLLDTVKFTVNMPTPENIDARFISTAVNEILDEGNKKTWKIRTVDADSNPMSLVALPSGFRLQDVGMELKIIKQVGDTLDAEFTWDPRCNVYDFSHKTKFDIKFAVEDQDTCNINHPDFLEFKLEVVLPKNASPVISTDLTSDQLQNGISLEVFQQLKFNVFGTDADGDQLTLAGQGLGFLPANHNVSFPKAIGVGSVASEFLWNIQCENVNLVTRNRFDFRFIVVDAVNFCRIYKADTLDVTVNVDPPYNIKPKLTIDYVHPQPQGLQHNLAILMGEEISFVVNADDQSVSPPDVLSLELIEATGNVEPSGYIFNSVESVSHADTIFTWKPDCSIFKNKVYENDYTFKFRASDNRCFNIMADTVEVNIKVTDIDGSDTEFLPANIITPNNDRCNDYFAMEGYEGGDCGEIQTVSLPKDNCVSKFEHIRIYNRWGKLVFESSSRDFRWNAANEANGVYYYTVSYTNKDYKGSITVRY